MPATPPLQPHAIAFRDARHGLLALAACPTGVACPAGRIELTSDGGRTWKVAVRPARLPQPQRTAAAPCPRATPRFAAAAGRLALAVCGSEAGAGNEEKLVYRSRDSGHRWRLVARTRCFGRHGSFGGLSCYGYPAGVAVAPDGFALLWESRGTLWASHDAGSHWRAVPVVRPELDFGVSAVALDGGVGFVLVARGGDGPRRLIETADSGRTWRVVHRWR